MERQLLKIYVVLISLVGCQQVEIIQDYENNKLVQSVEINNDLQVENTVITYENIWSYLLNKNPKNDEAYINERILFYMNRHLRDADKFEEYLNDSYYFIYFVINELEKENLPLELALIPFIESNYDPFSISSSGAVGMWQFMPKTGRLL
jgi:membrane-bound lytic murein transglycosylase D